MKSVYEMSGVEKAAALLVMLGPEAASEIMKQMDEDSVARLSVEIARLEKLNPSEKEDIIGEFYSALRDARFNVQGGTDRARTLLQSAFGDEKASEILEKIKLREVGREFDFLRDVDPEITAALLKNEMPQTIAVTLYYLKGAVAASVLKALPQNISRDAAVRMAKIKKIAPEAAAGIAATLKKSYRKHLEKGESLKSAGGVDALVDIIAHMNYDSEKKLIKNLDGVVPDLSGILRQRVYSFENIISLSNRDVRILIDEVNDDTILALSLKGMSDDMRFKLIRNMSQNRATDILAEMDSIGAVKVSEAEEARAVVVEIMRQLDENGVITVRRSGETYVY